MTKPRLLPRVLFWMALLPNALVLAQENGERWWDPSHFRELIIGDLPDDLPHANQGAYEGGLTASAADAAINNALTETLPREAWDFNIPTNGPPSPLFGAGTFDQQLLRFEEFGPEALNLRERRRDFLRNRRQPFEGWIPMPAPEDAQSGPDGEALEDFLSQQIFPLPTVLANTRSPNPWQNDIESFLGRALESPPAEGRPPGIGWSHQRWREFKPESYYQTATAGARENGGFRDDKQLHGYSAGEFGPGGLYHNTVGAPGLKARPKGSR